MSYKWINENSLVKRLADGACIPNDSRNRDWREFQEWIARGNTVHAADAPMSPALSDQRERDREVERLAKAVADNDQASINALVLKLLKGT